MSHRAMLDSCDGTTSSYVIFKENFTQNLILTDTEYVLENACPDVIDATIAAGEWGDALHPCAADNPLHGTNAPRETAAERKTTIAKYKQAEKKARALWIIKCTGDLKSQAMTYKDTDIIGLLAHCDKEFATATSTKLAQLVRHFLSHKLSNPQDIKEYNIKKKDQIRQLEEAGVDLHKVVAVVTYLENLPTEFDTFKAVRMMDEDLTIDDVMAGANDFYTANIQSTMFDEHNTTDRAMKAYERPSWRNRGQHDRDRDVNIGASQHQSGGCGVCGHRWHTSAHCFAPGGGLAGLNRDERHQYLESRKRAREEKDAGTSDSDKTGRNKALKAIENAAGGDRHIHDAIGKIKRRANELGL
jgi:hypothetical protein